MIDKDARITEIKSLISKRNQTETINTLIEIIVSLEFKLNEQTELQIK